MEDNLPAAVTIQNADEVIVIGARKVIVAQSIGVSVVGCVIERLEGNEIRGDYQIVRRET